MERKYEIPPEGGNHLAVGNWVEILEAYGRAETRDAIRVKSMRVGGKTLDFGRISAGRSNAKALRPHEGEVVFIVRKEGKTQFNIRL